MESEQSSWIPLMKRATTICCASEAKKRGRKKGQKSKPKCPTNKITNVFKQEKRVKADEDDFVVTTNAKEIATIFLTQKQKDERKKDELYKKKIEQEKIELEFERSLNAGKEVNPFLLATPQKIEQLNEKRDEVVFKLSPFPNVENVIQNWEQFLSEPKKQNPFDLLNEDEFIERVNSIHCKVNEKESQEIVINSNSVKKMSEKTPILIPETKKQLHNISKQKVDQRDAYKQCNDILATPPFRVFCESVCCVSLDIQKSGERLIGPQKGSKLDIRCKFFYARLAKSMAAVISDSASLWTDISHPVSHLEYLFSDQNFFKNWFKQFQPSAPTKLKRARTESASLFHTALLLCGKGCCGKTALAETLAKEFDLDIIELNTTMSRDGRSIRSIFGESFHSQTIGQNTESGSEVRNLFSANAKRRPSQKTNVKYHRTLFLFDDVDILFDKDIGYLQALSDIIETSKHPIIMTANSIEGLEKFIFKSNPLIVNFQPPPIETIFESISAIIASNGNGETLFSYTELLRLKIDLIYIFDYFQYDVRRLLLFYQFWWKGEKGYRIDQSKPIFQPLYGKLVKTDLKEFSKAIFQAECEKVSFLLQNSQIEIAFETYPFISLLDYETEVNSESKEDQKDEPENAQSKNKRKLEYDCNQLNAAAEIADSVSFYDCACGDYETKRNIYKEQPAIENDWFHEKLVKDCKDIEAFSLLLNRDASKKEIELSFDSFVRNSKFTSQNDFRDLQKLLQKKSKKMFQRRFELYNISPKNCFCEIGPFMAVLLKEKQISRRQINLSDNEFINEFVPSTFLCK